MLKWFKKQTPTVRGMVIVILVLIVGIILRWEYISQEAADAFKHRFRHFTEEKE